MILTESAAQKILELTGGADGRGLRIRLLPGGCCGTYYHFVIDDLRPGDMVVEASGAQVLLEPEVYPVLKGSRLDCGPALKPPRFRVLRNPNTPQKCPCGRSFGRPYPGRKSPQCQAYRPMPWDEP